MTLTRQFSLALETLLEGKADNASTSPQARPVPAVPTLSGVLAEIGPLPREALFVGIAPDGLPVLLNLHDSIPGPLLIIGDAGAGKTAFLQTVAHAAQLTHRIEEVQFGVITARADEWTNLPVANHCVGIFSTDDSAAADFLHWLSSWAHANKSKQAILLLLDDLEAVTSWDSDALHHLRWLLMRGPAHRAWPIVTLSAGRYGEVHPWIPIFRTRIFGKIEHSQIAEAVGADQASGLDRIEAGIQFALRERENWLHFWLPSCSES